MFKNKTVVTRHRAIGAVRQSVPGNKVKAKTDRFESNLLKKLYCSDISDPVCTYVQKKEWHPELNDYLFPPYVECEYVE